MNPMNRLDTDQLQVIPQAKALKTPKSKADVLDQIAFASGDARIVRTKGHVAEIHFADTNSVFLLTVHKPRGPKAKKEAPAKASTKRPARRGSRRAH